MNRAKFYEYLRSSAVTIYSNRLSQMAVDGMEALLDSCERNKVTDPHHVSNILAQVHRETGGIMSPIKETVYASHNDKNPSDQTVINRLNNAFAKGQLTWVRTPYWREGWFGRGMIQLTHRENYQRMSSHVGVDLVANRNLALDPKISADIAVIGMTKGLFTGKKLSDYNFPEALGNPSGTNPRRIVNGPDGSDAEVARSHRQYYAALEYAGGWSIKEPQLPIEESDPVKPIDTPEEVKPPQNGLDGLLKVIVDFFTKLLRG